LLQVVVAPLITVVVAALARSDEELVAEGIDVLQECATIDKPIINDHIEIVVQLLVTILENETVDTSVQQAAGSALTSIVEYRPKLISKKQLVAPIINSMVRIIAKSDAAAAGSLYTMGGKYDNTDEEDDEDYNEDVVAIDRSLSSPSF